MSNLGSDSHLTEAEAKEAANTIEKFIDEGTDVAILCVDNAGHAAAVLAVEKLKAKGIKKVLVYRDGCHSIDLLAKDWTK